MLYNRLPRQSSSPWIKSPEYYLLISEIRVRFQWAAGIAMREKRIALWKSKREPALCAWLLLSFVPRSASFFFWRPRSFFHDRLVECESVVARIQRGLSRQVLAVTRILFTKDSIPRSLESHSLLRNFAMDYLLEVEHFVVLFIGTEYFWYSVLFANFF